MASPMQARGPEDPGLMQVMKRCPNPSCGRRVRLRTITSTLAALHRALNPDAVNLDLQLLSYQCKCNTTFMLTLRELGLA